MTHFRKDGVPHGSSGSQLISRDPTGRSNAGFVGSTNPAADLKDLMSRRPDFDPANPESMFHNVGRKFTAELKLEFLTHLAECGRLGLSASYVGVTYACVIDHRKSDPRFDELVIEAMQHHREQTVAVMIRQAVEGHPEYKFDKEGNLLSARRMFEPALRLAILKGYAPEFVETQKQELTVQGGAVLVPSPTADVSNWANVVASLDAEQSGVSPNPVPSKPASGFLGGPGMLPSPDDPMVKASPSGAGEQQSGTPADGPDPKTESLSYLAASIPTTGWEAVRRRPARRPVDATQDPVDANTVPKADGHKE